MILSVFLFKKEGCPSNILFSSLFLSFSNPFLWIVWRFSYWDITVVIYPTDLSEQTPPLCRVDKDRKRNPCFPNPRYNLKSPAFSLNLNFQPSSRPERCFSSDWFMVFFILCAVFMFSQFQTWRGTIFPVTNARSTNFSRLRLILCSFWLFQPCLWNRVISALKQDFIRIFLI